MVNKIQKIWSIYKITNIKNNKIYIGQTVEPKKRWYQHRRDAANPKYPLHFAINKYGTDNFIFEVLLSCVTQDDANYMEEKFINEYGSLAKDNKGYNISLGGTVSPKSDEWKAAFTKWHASLAPEERERINKLQSEATFKQIAEKGHPAQGSKRTPEQSANLSRARRENPILYTPEIRQRMSEAHLGQKHSEETIKKRAASIAETNLNKKMAKIASGEFKCNAPNCETDPINIKKYKIVDGIRYCSLHGQRLKTTGNLELLPHTSHNKGKTSPTRIQFTEEQTLSILNDSRPLERIAKDFGVTAKVIKRVKLENKYMTYEELMKSCK